LCAYYGGGIYNGNTTVILTNVLLSHNSGSAGGGIYNYCSTMTLTSSTISNNSASDGGGIYQEPTRPLTLNSTIVALNLAPDNGDIHGVYADNSSLVSVEPGFVRNPSVGADGVWGTADDDYGDLHLTATSPAVDAGDNALLPLDEYDLDGDGDTGELLPIDLAGRPRICNGVVDIGAYEYVVYGDTDLDGDVDLDDLSSLAGNWGAASGMAWTDGDFDGDGDVDLDDLSSLSANWEVGVTGAGVAPAGSAAALPAENGDRHVLDLRSAPSQSPFSQGIAKKGMSPIFPLRQRDEPTAARAEYWTYPLFHSGKPGAKVTAAGLTLDDGLALLAGPQLHVPLG
jgi:hypothetical protein